MKEATGELNMTVITVVAIAAIAGIFYAFVWPGIQRSIVRNTCESQCPPNSANYDTCMTDCMAAEDEEYLNN